MRLILSVLLYLGACVVLAQNDLDRQQIQERIQPIGHVLVQEQIKASDVGAVEGKKEVGKSTYEQYCIVCHRDGLAGAPKFGDVTDWKPRLAGRTLDDLLVSVTKGLNAMPEKGTCVECSDTDLKNAIQYMLHKS